MGKEMETIDLFNNLLDVLNANKDLQLLQSKRPQPSLVLTAFNPLEDMRKNVTSYVNPAVYNMDDHLPKSQYYHPKEVLEERFKTTMCKFWLSHGRCFYGSECRYAHGEGELRKGKTFPKNMFKYRTILCENYTQHGVCPFGANCFFIHPPPTEVNQEKEANNNEENSKDLAPSTTAIRVDTPIVSRTLADKKHNSSKEVFAHQTPKHKTTRVFTARSRTGSFWRSLNPGLSFFQTPKPLKEIESPAKSEAASGNGDESVYIGYIHKMLEDSPQQAPPSVNVHTMSLAQVGMPCNDVDERNNELLCFEVRPKPCTNKKWSITADEWRAFDHLIEKDDEDDEDLRLPDVGQFDKAVVKAVMSKKNKMAEKKKKKRSN